jgi:alkylhydroperoxidase/carboxymuconolactone decarboxylase family protein YurZ
VTEQPQLISNAFQVFMSEAPKHAQAWASAVQGLAGATALDEKTSALAYLAVLAASRMEGGIPFHVLAAKKAGASRAEIISAILIGLPAVGNAVTLCLPKAIASFDGQ